MQASSNQPAFPLSKTLKVMTCVAAAMLVIELLFVPRMFGSPTGATTAVLLTSITAWLSGLLSVLPMVREQGKGPLAVVKVFFIGMGVRVLIAVVTIIIAIKGMKLPAGPVAAATMLMYLPLLFVETRMMVAYVKSLDTTGPSGLASETTSGSKPQATTTNDQTTAPCTEALA